MAGDRPTITALLARGVHLTSCIDRAYRRFDRLRSSLAVAFASDEFLDQYNALTYNAADAYRPDSSTFRQGLFDWEQQAVERYFPAAPARVLVGGAGGGREPFALVTMGYDVVAFDPAAALVDAMHAHSPDRSRLRAYRGSYASLPKLVDISNGSAIDLHSEAPFDAAIAGWSSFSHLRSDPERIAALRGLAALTRGPILVSYFPSTTTSAAPGHGGGVIGWIRRRIARRGPSVFSIEVGYYRMLRHDEMEDLVRRAGLTVVAAARDGNWPYVIVSE